MSTVAVHEPHTTLATTIRAERIKLLSLRSTRWALIMTVAVAITMSGLLTLVIAFAPPEEGMDVDEFIAATYGARPVLGAMAQSFLTAQVVVAIMGTLVVSTDLGSRALRTTVVAVPRRSLVVAAKLVVSGIAGFAAGIATGLAAYAIATPALEGRGSPAPPLDPATVSLLLQGSIGLALLAVLSSALAFLVRSTAVALGIVLGAYFLLPSIVQLVPVAGPIVAAVLPSAFGNGLLTPIDEAGWITAVCLAGFAAWAAAASCLAGIWFRHVDV